MRGCAALGQIVRGAALGLCVTVRLASDPVEREDSDTVIAAHGPRTTDPDKDRRRCRLREEHQSRKKTATPFLPIPNLCMTNPYGTVASLNWKTRAG